MAGPYSEEEAPDKSLVAEDNQVGPGKLRVGWDKVLVDQEDNTAAGRDTEVVRHTPAAAGRVPGSPRDRAVAACCPFFDRS